MKTRQIRYFHLLVEDDCTKISGICHDDADCFGNGTSFECRCKAGYTGDGKSCSGMKHETYQQTIVYHFCWEKLK